jgi:hypothetical protein
MLLTKLIAYFRTAKYSMIICYQGLERERNFLIPESLFFKIYFG